MEVISRSVSVEGDARSRGAVCCAFAAPGRAVLGCTELMRAVLCSTVPSVYLLDNSTQYYTMPHLTGAGQIVAT